MTLLTSLPEADPGVVEWANKKFSDRSGIASLHMLGGHLQQRCP